MPLKTNSTTCAIAAAFVLGATYDPAAAQQSLPGVVVQGVTIAPPPLQPAANAPVVDTSSEPAPKAAAVQRPRPRPAGQAAQPSQAAQAPPAAVAAQGEPALASDGGTGTIGSAGEAGGIAADRTGTSTSVITRAELERGQVRTVAEALRSLPGVAVSRTGGTGALTQVRIRGNEGNHTLVIIDGIEANDAVSGEFDFSDLATADVERIEVIRGAQSGLYGSSAGAGVINIITRSGRGPMRATASIEGGSFATKGATASLSGGSQRVWGSLTAAQTSTQGFVLAPDGSKKIGSQLTTVSGRIGVALADGLVLNLSGRQSHKRADYDDFGGNPGIFATAVDADNRLDHSVLLLGGNLQWDMLGGALTHVLKASHNETSRLDASPLFGSTENDSKRRKVGYSATYRFDTPGQFGSFRHFVTGLVEREAETFAPKSDYGFGFAADGISRDRSLVAGVAEYRTEIANTVFLAANVRRDDTNAFGTFDTWRTSASVKLPPVGPLALRPHASAGTGLKLPTLFEQFGSIPGQFTPNANLAPERLRGWDAGIETTITGTGLSLDVTYFSARLDNKIGTVFLPDFTSTAVNLDGTSTREGVEVAGRWAMSPVLSFGAAYTYTDARTPTGEVEVRRPPHAARADVAWLFASGRGTLNFALVYNGRNPDLAFRNADFSSARVGLDPYWLATVAGSYQIAPGLELFGRVENALDQRYQEVFGYNTPGIAAYAGVKVTLEQKPRIGLDASAKE